MPTDPGRDSTPGGSRTEVDAAWRLLRSLQPDASGARDSETRSRLRLLDGEGWETDPPATREAETLLSLFLPLRRRAAFVVGQLGQSVDGRIATEAGHSHYINGPEDIRRLHRLRALVDAVVVGAGTAEADDPRLTVREVDGTDPVRVVLDPSARLAPDRRLFQDGLAPTLWVQAPDQPWDSAEVGPFVERVQLPLSGAGGFEPAAVIRMLHQRGLRRVLVEGGGMTVSRFLQAGALDRLHLSVAPLILGSGRPGIRLPPIRTLDQALRPPVRHFLLGTDLLFDLDLSHAPRPE